METFSVLARRAARGFAPLAALMTLGVGAVRVSADPAQASATVQLASTSSINNSVFRPFGTVNGVTAENALTKDANGNYTNPDAITAYKALTLYVAGALRYPVHRAQSGAQVITDGSYYWESADRFTGVENPGKLTAPIQIDEHGNLTGQAGKLTSLVDMYKQGDDHVKAIILATIAESHDQVANAAQRDLAPGTGDQGGVYDGRKDGLMDVELKAAQADTTNDKLNAIVTRISAAGIDPWDASPKWTVMDYVKGTTDSILDAARPYGGVFALYKKLLTTGPQPNDLIERRTITASLMGISYPPGTRMASASNPAPGQ